MAEQDTVLLAQLLQQFPIIKYMVYGVVASSGATTRYLWDCLRGAGSFRLLGLLSYIVFGFFIGNLVGSFMTPTYEYRDGALLLSGFVVKELFEIIQKHGAGGVARLLRIDTTPADKDKDKNQSS